MPSVEEQAIALAEAEAGARDEYRRAGQEPATSAPAKYRLTRREMRQVWAHARSIENFWTTLTEVEPGAVARLAAAAARNRWEVIFVTQRPSTEGETAQRQSQRWLQAHGFECPSVFVLNGSRGKLADALALHAVIDDRVENCLDVFTDSKARPILICRNGRPAPPAATNLGITVATTFAEALDLLQHAKPSTFVSRIRRAMRM
jgi:transposase InsO family protein